MELVQRFAARLHRDVRVGEVMVKHGLLREVAMRRHWTRAGIAAVCVALSAAHAFAQSPNADKSTAKAAAKTQTAGAAGASDGGLKARVESLEEQLVDIQVVVGTLESLAKSGGGAAQPAFQGSSSGGSDAGRVDALETQIRALSGQVQQLSDQVRSMGGIPRRSESTGAAIPPQAAVAPPAFGSTTVTSDGDAIGGLIAGDTPPAGNFSGTPPPVATAALAPAGGGGDPKQLYETAYGYLLQRDYGAAEVAFDDFLKRFPSDSLSGNAQYWLGESHFVRGQYKAAAGAFLKGYQTYAQSAKAPDSLLKLAMSLDRLGQKDAACSSFSELNSKFPNAPQSVKTRAQSERQRVGCP
jgi:tol-pal system protein YbgF